MRYLIYLLISCLTACPEDQADLKQYIHQIKTRPLKKIEALPRFDSLKPSTGSLRHHQRNPFISVKNQRSKQPLESFSLSALKFVGTLKQEQKMWALIEQPDKYIRRVGVGDYMGTHHGRIVLIKNGLIRIEEFNQRQSEPKHYINLHLDQARLGNW